MFSYLVQRRMENNNYQGDLADIVGGAMSHAGSEGDWQFPPPADPMISGNFDDFGDPFSNMRDPFLHELDVSSSGFFTGNSTEMMQQNGVVPDRTIGFGGGVVGHGKVGNEEEMKRPCNIISRMLQISPNSKLGVNVSVSPCESPVMNKASPSPLPLVSNVDMINSGNSTKSGSCLLDNSSAGSGVQISSPRNTGIKRRKSQAKKVVCIPAPAPANSRPSGEVVPSDLWAWRKYGQKPIKGSPYPRGYYRCSSSKGCSARKQVERSRTDPNMLVITYTSEHNHPWPTQRNALAGSTRSQPSKNNSTTNNNNNSGTNSKNQKGSTTMSTKEEEQQNKEQSTTNTETVSSSSVKEEMDHAQDRSQQVELDCGDQVTEGFESYRPAMLMDSSNQSHEDFFADLGEIEADPLNLLFTQDFSNDQERENKGLLDPFSSLFDWNNNTAATSFGEPKEG
ncbi:hypothetical protein NMG60_11005189 [Bertholletia excelsa]